jgi:hypothetical protein
VSSKQRGGCLGDATSGEQTAPASFVRKSVRPNYALVRPCCRTAALARGAVDHGGYPAWRILHGCRGEGSGKGNGNAR